MWELNVIYYVSEYTYSKGVLNASVFILVRASKLIISVSAMGHCTQVDLSEVHHQAAWFWPCGSLDNEITHNIHLYHYV